MKCTEFKLRWLINNSLGSAQNIFKLQKNYLTAKLKFILQIIKITYFLNEREIGIFKNPVTNKVN